MKQPATLPWFLTPPSASMEEYAAFVEELLSHADPVKVARQKALEEQITTPFRLDPAADAPDAPLSEAMEQKEAWPQVAASSVGLFPEV